MSEKRPPMLVRFVAGLMVGALIAVAPAVVIRTAGALAGYGWHLEPESFGAWLTAVFSFFSVPLGVAAFCFFLFHEEAFDASPCAPGSTCPGDRQGSGGKPRLRRVK